jgi:hypothetical protein
VGERLAAPHKARRTYLLSDDLDLFLLEAAWDHGEWINLFSDLDPGIALNMQCPPYSQEELILAFSELFSRGDLIAHSPKYEWSHRREVHFTPSRDEIEAAFHGVIPICYDLTAQGGKRWEDLTQADWSRYVDWSSDCRFVELTGQSREYLEYRLELERRAGTIGGPVEWKELEPWKALAWKTFPHAWQVRYRTVPESPWRHTLVDDCYPPPWDQRLRRWPSGPVELAERRVRVAVHQPAQEDLWPLKRLQKRMSRRWPVRQEFAAACAYAQREETEVVLREFEKCYSRTVRFSLVRELVRRRETRAIPSLVRMLWGEQPQLALWALGEFADDTTLPVLSALLEWGYVTDREQAHLSGALVRAVGRFGAKALSLAERELQSDSGRRQELAVAILRVMDSAASLRCWKKSITGSRLPGRVVGTWIARSASSMRSGGKRNDRS